MRNDQRWIEQPEDAFAVGEEIEIQGPGHGERGTHTPESRFDRLQLGKQPCRLRIGRGDDDAVDEEGLRGGWDRCAPVPAGPTKDADRRGVKGVDRRFRNGNGTADAGRRQITADCDSRKIHSMSSL